MTAKDTNNNSLSKGDKNINNSLYKKSQYTEDLLGRTPITKNLTEIIKTDEPLVFALNAPWGAGKTIFVKKLWQPYLEKEEEIKGFYFSAWEDDFSKEPLLVILNEFEKFIKANKIKDKDKVLIKLKNNVKDILINSAPILLSLASQGVINEKSIARFFPNKKHNIARFFPDKKHNPVADFKKNIKLLLNKIKSKPLVIFIDELDRCRPLYAIEFLERIKHLFGIKNLVFVLSIDKTNLAESIKSQYGNIDTDNYLRRFIDIEFNLPKGDISNFCEILFDRFKLADILMKKDTWWYTKDSVAGVDFFIFLAEVFEINCRTLEQIFSSINIIFKVSSKRTKYSIFVTLIFLLFLKYHNPVRYDKLIKERNNEQNKEYITEIIAKCNAIKTEDSRKKHYISIIEILMKTIGMTDKEFINYKESLTDDVKKKACNAIYFKDYRQYEDYPSIIINLAIEKIEFINNFEL